MDLLNPPRLDKKAVKQAFNRGARHYDKQAALQHEVARRLLERLDYIRVEPKVILDLGCGTGQAIAALGRMLEVCRLCRTRVGRVSDICRTYVGSHVGCFRLQMAIFDSK